MKSKWFSIVLINFAILLCLGLGSNMLNNQQLTIEAAPAGFIKVGQKYSFGGAICAEIVSIGSNGWVRAKNYDGSYSWYNTDLIPWIREGCTEIKMVVPNQKNN